ncbi:PREDICTED: alpha-(1,3)-fucosyltransferase 5-like, partial [Priapulus caudatus]|uniref:Fucosyltransferase n=1 Tax=Priapulus caudatus TaxID=37621 RepID=A0ABM1F604_PRICU
GADSAQRRKLILFWTPFYGLRDYGWGVGGAPFADGCPPGPAQRCEATTDRGAFARSDAVVVHARDTRLRPPGGATVRPGIGRRAPPGAATVAATRPAAARRRTAEARRGRRRSAARGRRAAAGRRRPAKLTSTSSSKDAIVAWIVSNCAASSGRGAYVAELQRHLAVAVYGGCGARQCARGDGAGACRGVVERRHRFLLVFENAICRDYASEKLFEALRWRVVPVVMGGADYARVAPPGSYVDATRYPDPRDLAALLLRVAADDAAYAELLRAVRETE